MADPIDPKSDTTVPTETVIIYRRGTFEPAVWFPFADMTRPTAAGQRHGKASDGE